MERATKIEDTCREHNHAENTVEAVLNYIAETSEKPVYYAFEPPPGPPAQTARFIPQTVVVRDGRAVADDLSLDKQGFELTHHETSVNDFYDRKEVQDVYYPEVERLLREATGANRVVIFDHQVRCLPLAERKEKDARGYGKVVHNDYTAKSGPRRVRDHLPPAEAEELLKNRFAEINVWRPIRGPIESTPLAVCDARTIAPGDFVASDLVYPDRSGRPIASRTIPVIAGFIFHGWSATRLSCSSAMIRKKMGVRASPPTPHSKTQPAR